MGSPMVESSRVEPHKKAHFSLQLSDRITSSGNSHSSFSSVKFNHKPAQTSDSRRTTTITCTSANAYSLKLEDSTRSGDKNVFTFKGNRTAPKKSYVLLFDQSTQQATLEPLSTSYTFNLATKNDKDASSQHAKIYPKKSKDDVPDQDGHDDLFGEGAGDDESGDPDPDNPYDFRHFLAKDKEKRGDDSDYPIASSPDCRAGNGSAANTPQFGARKPAVAAVAKTKTTEPAVKKRRTAEADLFMKKKSGPKKAQPPPPSIQLERRASERPATEAVPKARSKPAGPPASKIKSSELVHSSDDSDMDADAVSSPRHVRRSPSPQRAREEEDDAEGESDDDGGLEIEVPDARPSRPRNGGALASLGLGQSLGAGGGFKSPSAGPISLASAASSVQGSPNPHNFTPRKSRAVQDNSIIDFGDLGGGDDAQGEEYEDDEAEVDMDDGNPDVDDFDIGPPARQSTMHDRKASMGTSGIAVEEDEEDPLYQEMMAGLADGDSSEESEENVESEESEEE